MKSTVLTVLLLASALVGPGIVGASEPAPWLLPRNRDCYLMEDDLVYARFLALAHGGTYQQINRDSNGSIEVDRGRWEQDAGGALHLHSSCRALRPRALICGPLSVMIVGHESFETMPPLLESMRRFLGEFPDAVFDAGSVAEINAAGTSALRTDRGAATFDRTDADGLVARIEESLQSERDGTDVLHPVRSAATALFMLSGNPFRGTDLATVRRDYRVDAAAPTPFHFARIDAAAYAREVGHWRPLHLPGGAE